jgi:hypothetical protein
MKQTTSMTPKKDTWKDWSTYKHDDTIAENVGLCWRKYQHLADAEHIIERDCNASFGSVYTYND